PQGDRQLGQLSAVRGAIDLCGHAPKQRADLQPRLVDLLDERSRERAVAAGPIDRNLIRLRRIGDDHAPRRLDPGEPTRADDVACGRQTGEAIEKWIAAAGVQYENLHAPRPVQSEYDVVHSGELEVEAELVFELGVDRHQIVEPVVLDSVA